MASEDLAMVAAVVGCRVNGVGPGVDPVNSLHGQVEGQTVGPCSVPVRRHNEDDLSSVSIAGHVARFDSNLSKIVNLKDGPGLFSTYFDLFKKSNSYYNKVMLKISIQLGYKVMTFQSPVNSLNNQTRTLA